MENNYSYSGSSVQTAQVSLMKSLYLWMSIALAVTGITAMAVDASYSLQQLLFGGRYTFLVLAIAEVALVIYLTARITRMSFATAMVSFLAYSFLNGLTLSVIFLAYTKASIASTFFVTAGTFAAMSLYGYTTKKDLTAIGSFMIMGVWGIVIASLVNMFLQSSGLSYAISFIAVIAFTALTAYDTQNIRQMYYAEDIDEIASKKAVAGALSLYMDFINIFIALLNLFGDRR